MRFKTGDRVRPTGPPRVSSPDPNRPNLKVILDDSRRGTVVGYFLEDDTGLFPKWHPNNIILFITRQLPTVEWDAGIYSVYDESCPTDPEVRGKGTVELAAFRGKIHRDWLVKAND